MQVEGFSDLERMGAGGLGDVYRARRLSTGSLVAIKVLRDWSDSSASLHRARRELKALVGLQGHPNVVHVEDFIESDGVPVLVMEYAPGGSVYDLLKSEGALSLPQGVLVGQQTAAALAATHDLGIIHLDIKPQNLLIGPFGQIKVCDFGIAALTQDEQFKTRTNAASYRYASPEQLNDEPDVGSSADVYSLGATLAHLVNGKPLPVIGPQATRVRQPFSYQGGDEVSAEAVCLFEDTINECIEIDPNDRPTAASLVERFAEIETVLGSDRARALPVGESQPTLAGSADIVPRVVGASGPVEHDPVEATVARTDPGAAAVPVAAAPGYGPGVYATAPPGYSGTGPTGAGPTGTGPTGTGAWMVTQQQPRRSRLAIFTVVLALVAAFASLGAVAYVLTRQQPATTVQSAGNRSDSKRSAASDEGTDTTESNANTTPETTSTPTTAAPATTAAATLPPAATPAPTPAPTQPTPAPAAASVPWERMVIGTASGGSEIVAFHGGTPGGTSVMVVGGLQPLMRLGESVSSELLALDVPPGVEMWVIPLPVPDGDSVHDRRSRNGVDINRNFPVDWAAAVAPENRNYQGPAPASEPETQAIIGLAQQARPVWEIHLLGPVESDYGLSYDPEIENIDILYRFHDFSGLTFDQDAGACTGSSECNGTMTQYMNETYGSAFTALLPPNINSAQIAQAIMLTAAELA